LVSEAVPKTVLFGQSVQSAVSPHLPFDEVPQLET
jgi:hypothetical protein